MKLSKNLAIVGFFTLSMSSSLLASKSNIHYTNETVHIDKQATPSNTIDPRGPIKRITKIRSAKNTNIKLVELKNALIVDFKEALALDSKRKTIEIKDRKGRRVFFGEAFSNDLASIVPLHKFKKGKYKLIILAENFELKSDFQKG